MYSPQEIAVNFAASAQAKAAQKWYKTFVLAIMAGVFIALAGALATYAASGKTGMEATLVKGAVFPVGLMLVVLCGSELFTGNCLLLAPVLHRDITIKDMLKILGVVYLGNLAGSILIAALAAASGIYHSVAETVVQAAEAKTALGFTQSFVRGILCNLLVCLAVWVSLSSKTTAGKILAVYPPIFAFVVLGLEHSVANMYYLSAGLFAAGIYGVSTSLNVGNALLSCLLPSTLGNVVGGMCLVALPYWFVYLKNK